MLSLLRWSVRDVLSILSQAPILNWEYISYSNVFRFNHCSLVFPLALPPVSPRPAESSPVFDKKMSNQPLSHGQTAYFECKVCAYPPPEILWTRRGHPLVDKARLVCVKCFYVKQPSKRLILQQRSCTVD